MTYTTASNLTALTEYLAAYLVEELGNTTSAKRVLEETQQTLAGAIRNGIEAFCGGAGPTGLRYAVNIMADNADKPVIFVQWSVSDIREQMEQAGWTSENLPTLFSLADDQLYELLEHCVRKGYSFFSSLGGLMLDELEDIAADYFRA